MKEEIKSLIGKPVEVITNGEVKEIFVKDVFENSKGKCLVEDSNGNIYSEDDINWRYRLSLGACLMVWLDKYDYINLNESLKENNANKYETQLEDLFDLLMKQGYMETTTDKE